jgi:hypothetical protein
MGLSSKDYRQRFQTIARFVDWKPPKRLKASDKAKITRYSKRIGKALAKGYKPVKCRNDGRIEKAHRTQGIRGLPGMKVVLVKPTGNGFRNKVNADGSIQSVNAESGISKVTIEAQFFDAEEADETEVEEEAARLVKAARSNLGHKPQRCAVAYWGGENAWSEVSFLADLLIVRMNQYANAGGFPADGVSFYWIKKTKQVREVQQRLRDQRTKAAERRAERRRRSDV